MICAAETPAGGQTEEITHNLLTLDEGIALCQHQPGRVAASALDGRLHWISTYPRQATDPAGRTSARPISIAT